MTTMFVDYIKAVTDYYHTKKSTKTLSMLLEHPTPASIKEACKVECSERFSKKDYQILKTFFGEAEDVKTCLAAIGKCDIDKFRPLQNFLKGKINDPDPKNVELLAWLMGFEGRPFDYQKNYNGFDAEPVVEREENQIQKKKESEQQKEDGPIQPILTTGPKKADLVTPLPAKTKKINKIVAVAVVIAILAPVTYLSINRSPDRGKPEGIVLTGQESCMYWTGDHYQKVPCAQKLGDTMLIPLDSARLMRFKKISNRDVITKNSIDNVWYCKISEDSLELYTADGVHPVYRNKKLKHLTTYMYNNYIKPRSK